MVPSSGMVIWKSDSKLQKESFEFLVGPVYLVDKQHRRTLSRIVKGLEQGALNKELFAEQLF